MLTPHNHQTYSVQVWSGTPGFQVFKILSTFKGPRQVLDFLVLHKTLLTQYCAGDKIKKNEMDGAYGAYGEGEKRVQGFGGKTWRKETTGETQAQIGG